MLNNLIHREIDWSQYSDLETIGIDEISNRKGYQDFIAVISAKDKYGNLTILAVLDSLYKFRPDLTVAYFSNAIFVRYG